MVSFENTEIAFGSRSDYELKKAYLLFKLIGNNKLVKWSKPLAGLAVKISFPFKYIIKETIYEHFCGGETIRECESTINKLSEFKVSTILDYSVEGKESEEDFELTANEIIDTQERAALDGNVPFNVFKLTGLARFGLLEKVSDGSDLSEAETHEFARVKERVERICKKAEEIDRYIMMDAEETWIQPVMDKLMLEMMQRFNKEKALVINTFQMYRHDRLQVLKDLIEKGKQDNFHVGVKLVRGAYMEKERARALQMNYPSPIQPDKEACDRDYNLALELVVDNIDRMSLCAGSHNEKSSQYLAELIDKKGIEKDDQRIYFSQLLGMSDHISFNLAHLGYNVAKYVPYGPVKDVLPYLIRRADENTSVAGQSSRELNLLSKERARRKQSKR
ncbi:MAG: proline dehydrogenase family protein [Bacteroidia bacterium]